MSAKLSRIAGMVAAALAIASAAEDVPPVQLYRVGNGIPESAPDGETPVSVLGLSQSPDGTLIASVLTDADNVALMEFHDGAWSFQDFVQTVTKSPWHSYAVEMTGKVYTDNGAPGGTPLLASALTQDGRHYSSTEAGIWDDTTTPSVLIHPLEVKAHALAAGANGALVFAAGQAIYYRPDANSGFSQLAPSDGSHDWSNTRVDAVAIDGEGRVWVGGERGVGAWDGATWTLYPSEDPAEAYTAIVPGASGAVWFGTSKGVRRIQDGTWVEFAGKEWLPDDGVNALLVDAAGAAWAATKGGIGRISATAAPAAEPEPEEESTTTTVPVREALKDLKGVT